MHATSRRSAARPAPGTLSRRSVLAAAGAGAALALAACTSGSDGPEPTPSGSEDPDFALRGRVFDAEQALIAAYDATAARHPSLRARLVAIRDQHAAHAAAVSVAGDLSASGRRTANAPSVPVDPDAALTALARLEAAAATARVGDCQAAARASLARVLSLIGGSEASHAVALGGTG